MPIKVSILNFNMTIYFRTVGNPLIVFLTNVATYYWMPIWNANQTIFWGVANWQIIQDSHKLFRVVAQHANWFRLHDEVDNVETNERSSAFESKNKSSHGLFITHLIISPARKISNNPSPEPATLALQQSQQQDWYSLQETTHFQSPSCQDSFWGISSLACLLALRSLLLPFDLL